MKLRLLPQKAGVLISQELEVDPDERSHMGNHHSWCWSCPGGPLAGDEEAVTMESKAKEFAKRHGYKLRRMPHSAKEPNAWFKVTTPAGETLRSADWAQALQIMMHGSYKK